MSRKYKKNEETSPEYGEQGDGMKMNQSSGAIKFRNNKRKTKIKAILKGIAFVLIASVSGGVTAAVIIESKFEPPTTTGPTYNSNENIYLTEPYPVTSSVIPKTNIKISLKGIGLPGLKALNITTTDRIIPIMGPAIFPRKPQPQKNPTMDSTSDIIPPILANRSKYFFNSALLTITITF